VTALVVTKVGVNRARVSCVDVAEQHFTDVPDAVIDALVAKGDVLHSAGGVTVEDPLLAPFIGKRIGTLDSSTLGLVVGTRQGPIA
jgi:septum formation protein